MRLQLRYGYLLFIMIMLMMSWEAQRNQAPLAVAAIPEESIRLRILANSDRAHDQWLKEQVRDRIVEKMNGWVAEPMTLEEARIVLESHLDELHQLVGDTIRDSGAAYTYDIKLGQAQFPAKWYGDRVYPAGLYEALVVTIGAGEGKNWWCVLFPPLCFIDTVSGKAANEQAGREDAADSGEDVHQQGETAVGDTAAEMSSEEDRENQSPDIKMRFFLVEWLEKLVNWFKGLFK